MKKTTVAYIAGAIDADGCISIKRCTTRMRVKRDCRNPIYKSKITLGQVTPEVPQLLKKCFGGCVYISKPQTKNSKPMFTWTATDRLACKVVKIILPYLLIKKQQAQTVIELDTLKNDLKKRKLSTWYALANPNWRKETLLTTQECADLLGYTNLESVSQAIRLGTLLSASPGGHGRTQVPKIPKQLTLDLSKLKGKGHKFISCPQFMNAQHELWLKMSQLNKLGINGTVVNHRTGHYRPKKI
jgi:hypothetical protein